MPQKKKLLIAGGGYADIPLIKAAKALGFFVITSGNRADDLGHQYSDECRLEDFSNEKAMLKLAESLKIDAICASCNDFSALTSAYVAEKMGLPGHDSYEVAQIIHHKDRYRDFAIKHGIPTPYAEGFSSIGDALTALQRFRFPIIVKPVDLTGGKGITKVDREENAESALASAFERSRAKRIVVEEFIEGSRHGLTTFLRDGKIVFHFSDNEHYYLNQYLVSAASAPGNVPISAVQKLCETSEKIANLLSLKTGIFHIQFILHQDEPVIIEICRRAPGDLYIELVKHATGVEYPAYIVRSAAGMDISDLKQVEPRGYFTRHCIMTNKNGFIRGVNIASSVKDKIIDQFMWWKEGDEVKDYMTHKCGIVFLKFSSKHEMLNNTEMMQELIKVDVSPN